MKVSHSRCKTKQVSIGYMWPVQKHKGEVSTLTHQRRTLDFAVQCFVQQQADCNQTRHFLSRVNQPAEEKAQNLSSRVHLTVQEGVGACPHMLISSKEEPTDGKKLWILLTLLCHPTLGFSACSLLALQVSSISPDFGPLDVKVPLQS